MIIREEYANIVLLQIIKNTPKYEKYVIGTCTSESFYNDKSLYFAYFWINNYN